MILAINYSERRSIKLLVILYSVRQAIYFWWVGGLPASQIPRFMGGARPTFYVGLWLPLLFGHLIGFLSTKQLIGRPIGEGVRPPSHQIKLFGRPGWLVMIMCLRPPRHGAVLRSRADDPLVRRY